MRQTSRIFQGQMTLIFRKYHHLILRQVFSLSIAIVWVLIGHGSVDAEDAAAKLGSENQPQRAYIDGVGPGWKTLEEDDFVNVNCEPKTFTWEGSTAHCTGKPIGVIRTKDQYTNFELIVEWKHLKSAGNSGIFLWADEESVAKTPPNDVPKGIEVQILENDYPEFYTKQTGKKADWFTTHGDIFPVHGAKMKPFAPVAPDGIRSFPTKQLSLPTGNWNHYYIRAVNGEVRLWVNGEEVSGGSECEPRHGYLALESEGSPVDFRNIRIRTLP